MPSQYSHVPKTDEEIESFLSRLCGVPFVRQSFDDRRIFVERTTSLANYLRGCWEGRLSKYVGWHYQSVDPYIVSTPDVHPFPPFDPWKQTTPVVGILGECAYCWEAIIPVPSVLTLIYTP